MCGDFDPVTIQLLVVAMRRLLRKALRVPWQEHFKSGMTLDDHPFVHQGQHSECFFSAEAGQNCDPRTLGQEKDPVHGGNGSVHV